MRGLQDPRMQRMMGGVFTAGGMLLLAILGPHALVRPQWPPGPELETEIMLATALGCLFAGVSLLWRHRRRH